MIAENRCFHLLDYIVSWSSGFRSKIKNFIRKRIYIKRSFQWNKPDCFSCICLEMTAYIVTMVNCGQSLVFNYNIFAHYFSLCDSSLMFEPILSSPMPIASFFWVLYFSHIKIKNQLRNSWPMRSRRVATYLCPALYEAFFDEFQGAFSSFNPLFRKPGLNLAEDYFSSASG